MSNRRKILVVFGTRPEAIKMAPIIQELRKFDNAFEVKICVTAQHRSMLDQVLIFFKIYPDFDLNLMKPAQSLNELSSRILFEIDKVLVDFEPNLVLVHGDTSTSIMSALAAFHRRIKVAHVEAGLRTYDKHAPFPEEINRQLISRIADCHFAPTERAVNNLVINEGVSKSRVFNTGNTVIDALLWSIKNIDKKKSSLLDLANKINFDKRIIVVTGHRRENFGEKFENFCDALKEISNLSDVQIVYPVHLNPNIDGLVRKKLGNTNNILLLPPLGYEEFVWLLNKSYLIITDSGGIQEEAPSLNKPVLVTRDKTERQEGVDAGVLKLVGTNKRNIIDTCIELLNSDDEYKKMIGNENPYGNGEASKIIVEKINSCL